MLSPSLFQEVFVGQYGVPVGDLVGLHPAWVSSFSSREQCKKKWRRWNTDSPECKDLCDFKYLPNCQIIKFYN